MSNKPNPVLVDADDFVQIIRDNERMRMALTAIRIKSENSSEGWRHEVGLIAKSGLGEVRTPK